MKYNKLNLFNAQKALTPECRRMKPEEVYSWALNSFGKEQQNSRLRSMACCWNFPDGIFFRTTGDSNAIIGYRYGIKEREQVYFGRENGYLFKQGE